MAVSTLAGCGGGGDKKPAATGSKDGNYEDFITVDVYDEFANYQGIQSGWFAKVVKDKFNMELNIIAPNVAGGGDTLFQTRSAAGELGDLVLVGTKNGKFSSLVDSGLIMDCSALVEGKDIMKNYGEAVAKTNELVNAEGVYGFPSAVSSQAAAEPSEGLDPLYGPYARWDYYKELGYPKMENLDDFLNVLADMQKLARETEGRNNIYAISLFKDWDDAIMNDAKQLVCMYGYDALNGGFVLSKADGSDYQSVIDDDSLYIQALHFLNKANEMGLVDPDSTSQNYDTWSTKYKTGDILYCPWPWVGQSMFNTAENKAESKGYMMLPVDDMQIYSYGNHPEGDTTQIIAIGSNAEDPQRLADFIDWLYTPEGVEISGQANGAAGPQGLTWEMGSDGQPVLTDFGKSALPNNQVEVPAEFGGGNWQDGLSALNFKTTNLEDIDPNTGVCYDWLCWQSTIDANKTELDSDWASKMGADTTMGFLKDSGRLLVAPGSSYSTPEEDSNITTIRGQCKSTIVDNSWKMIFASAADFDKPAEKYPVSKESGTADDTTDDAADGADESANE